MKKTLRIIAGVALAIAMIGQFSCSSEPVVVPENENSLFLLTKEMKEQIIEVQKVEAVDVQIIEEILDEVLMDLEQYDFLKSESVCPEVTVVKPDTGKYPKVITRDFGEGCENKWGVVQSGKIIITLYGPWLEEGTVRIVEFEDYTRRGVGVDGKKKIVCQGLNEDGLYVHTIRGEVEMNRADTLLIKREIHKSRTLLTGWGDPDTPKEWFIEGHVNVSKSNGIDYIVNIPQPLYRIQGCRWPQAGIKVLHFNVETPETKPNNIGDYKHKVSIDYSYDESDDACDSWVLRWINDEEPEAVNLKK